MQGERDEDNEKISAGSEQGEATLNMNTTPYNCLFVYTHTFTYL